MSHIAPRSAAILAASVLLAWLAAHDAALAQAHNPFSVGISEGGGSASGLSGWLLAKQAALEQTLSGAVRAAKADGSATWMLAGLSLLYGVFHAAGPGHGKAVVASYMFANERALKRGVILSFAAAALQGLVAILLVGALALIFHATAQAMKDAAHIIEMMSYAGIAALGGWLVWRKGGAFLTAVRDENLAPDPLQGAPASPSTTGPMAHAVHDRHDHHDHRHRPHGCDHDHLHDHDALGDHVLERRRVEQANDGLRHVARGAGAQAVSAGHVHGADCGHYHAPEPATLGEGFKWSSAMLTVVAAGLRPCSGAILVLVFALAQGMFAAGIIAVAAMSLGTAVTTSGLATLAVLAGGLAVRLSGASSRRGILIARGLEASAGLFVMMLGMGLFLGVLSYSGA